MTAVRLAIVLEAHASAPDRSALRAFGLDTRSCRRMERVVASIRSLRLVAGRPALAVGPDPEDACLELLDALTVLQDMARSTFLERVANNSRGEVDSFLAGVRR